LAEDGPRLFPEGSQVAPGQVAARIRIGKDERPNGFSITAWRAVDAQGFAVGPSDSVDFMLRPRKRGDDVVAWIARFKAVVAGDYYIAASGQWRDREGCGGMQSAAWTFHLSVV
jgi:hypothetical protein